MNLAERLAGCIIGGAIGDAWGSAYEGLNLITDAKTFYLVKPTPSIPEWAFTDDTQLTLITLEALLQTEKLPPGQLAAAFVKFYKRGMLTGLGASTLLALKQLEAGAHWSMAGRDGEFGAGNGAAMRIAPFAFWNSYSKNDLRDFCRITHRNEEAYVGALAVVLSLKQVIDGNWRGDGSLFSSIIPQLPDTRVRDRLIELANLPADTSIAAAASFGTSGYVVDSVPFAIFCASQVRNTGLKGMYESIIRSGGDVDTNASIAGQLAGAFAGEAGIDSALKCKLYELKGAEWLQNVIESARQHLA